MFQESIFIFLYYKEIIIEIGLQFIYKITLTRYIKHKNVSEYIDALLKAMVIVASIVIVIQIINVMRNTGGSIHFWFNNYSLCIYLYYLFNSLGNTCSGMEMFTDL